MEMIDMRKLTPEARQERRRQVIKLRRAGWTYEAIAADLGLSRTGVFDICKRYDQGGAKALVDKPCGRPVGVLRALSEEQRARHPSSGHRPHARSAQDGLCVVDTPGGAAAD
ncbi:MAG: helix-turn-helix domain-containing protein [Burkholderiales bacterium]|nr:helix-turn-helix domain-containing protein [Burkholderiales bacterium]